ncbi:MAG: CHAT domain-containing protein, partial [Chloroflexi bacterium]|nr:CHAT domain-containing protein [Chloroflexota bacterium]
MADVPFTYLIRCSSLDRVQAEKRDPDGNLLGQPSGPLGYHGRPRAHINNFVTRAAAGALTGSEPTKLGELLFDALLGPELSTDFFSFYESARRLETPVRIGLEIDERVVPEVAGLPWEFMHASVKSGHGTIWLATAPDLVVSRRPAHWTEPPRIELAAGERLRILLAVAAPDRDEAGPLGAVKYEEVWAALQSLQRTQSKNIELLDLVLPATVRSLDTALERRPHIFHLVAHGRLSGSNAQIALVDPALGSADWTDAERFGDLFNRYRPGVVLLQACEGAAQSPSKAFSSLASQLVEQDVPVVVAMQYDVSNSTAKKFALEFYNRLAEEDPVDKAAQEGRRQIALGPLGYKSRDFATPVLFMRAPDGILFERAGTPGPKGASVSRPRNVWDPQPRPIAFEQLIELDRLVAGVTMVPEELRRLYRMYAPFGPPLPRDEPGAEDALPRMLAWLAEIGPLTDGTVPILRVVEHIRQAQVQDETTKDAIRSWVTMMAQHLHATPPDESPPAIEAVDGKFGLPSPV